MAQHRKRDEDVQEILAAKIDVSRRLKLQNIESSLPSFFLTGNHSARDECRMVPLTANDVMIDLTPEAPEPHEARRHLQLG